MTMKKKNGWELTTGMIEVLWKENIGTRVRIEGAVFVSLAAVKEAVGERELHKHDSIPTYDSHAAEGCITCIENRKISDLLSSLGISDKDHE